MTNKRVRLPTDAFETSAPVLKRLGQNFLINSALCHQIVDSLNITSADEVIEVGPGRGALTNLLFKKAGHVSAVEIDKTLASELAKAFVETALTVVHEDALRTDWSKLCQKEFQRHFFVANLPYYVATPLVVKALESGAFDKVAFMIQKELAERFVARQGSKTYGAVSVLLQATSSVRILFNVPRSAFVPVPKVDSCFVLLEPLHDLPFKTSDLSRFLRSCFMSRRKNIKNNLSAFSSDQTAQAVLAEAGIAETARPEQIDPQSFVALFRCFQAHAGH